MRGSTPAVPRRCALAIGLAVLLLVLALPGRPRSPSAIYAHERAVGPAMQSGYHVPTTISPEWQAALRTWTGPTSETFPAPHDLEGWRALQRQGERSVDRAAESILARYQATITPRDLAGVPVLEIRPKGWQENGRVLVYTHGGAYTFNSARSTLSSSVPVADATGLRVISIDYTLAPFSRWDQTTDQVVAVVQALLAEGTTWQEIALYGDSAGGGLAAGAVLKMRDRGIGMPAAIFLWSPWSDLAEIGDTYVTLASADPLLVYPGQLERSAAAYAEPADRRHPYVSPVYADFSRGFPPTLIQAGTKEIFLSNAVRLYRALDLAGVPVTLDLYEGMPHVFQGILPESPEARTAFEKSKRFLDQHLGSGEARSFSHS
jgi:acetyl esterase/lipase